MYCSQHHHSMWCVRAMSPCCFHVYHPLVNFLNQYSTYHPLHMVLKVDSPKSCTHKLIMRSYSCFTWYTSNVLSLLWALSYRNWDEAMSTIWSSVPCIVINGNVILDTPLAIWVCALNTAFAQAAFKPPCQTNGSSK